MFIQMLPNKINRLTASCHLVARDLLALGADNGQIYIVPALKLIWSLFTGNDQYKDNFGIELIDFH